MTKFNTKYVSDKTSYVKFVKPSGCLFNLHDGDKELKYKEDYHFIKKD
jgi:hypothetical protein